ncbi:TPA: hypothetical protein DCW61_04990 [Candidatus Uhrbacteria bacterium]|nr:hypothetical protein [Candidatus Uhrbacteria bacterium]
MKLQTIVSAFEEQITNRVLRAILREYTGIEIPVCTEEESILQCCEELTGNPYLGDEDLKCYGDLPGFGRCGIKVGNLLLVLSNHYYDEENEPATMTSIYLLPDSESPTKEEKKVGITIRVEEPNALAEIIRARIWPDEDDYAVYNRYIGTIPSRAKILSEEETRGLFPANYAPRENYRPHGFSTQVDDIAVSIAIYWDGDGIMVMKLQEGSVQLNLINTDCKKSDGWKVI